MASVAAHGERKIRDIRNAERERKRERDIGTAGEFIYSLAALL